MRTTTRHITTAFRNGPIITMEIIQFLFFAISSSQTPSFRVRLHNIIHAYNVHGVLCYLAGTRRVLRVYVCACIRFLQYIFYVSLPLPPYTRVLDDRGAPEGRWFRVYFPPIDRHLRRAEKVFVRKIIILVVSCARITRTCAPSTITSTYEVNLQVLLFVSTRRMVYSFRYESIVCTTGWNVTRREKSKTNALRLRWPTIYCAIVYYIHAPSIMTVFHNISDDFKRYYCLSTEISPVF